MRDMGVDWFEPYDQVMDISRGPEWSQWFLGGKLNIAHNCRGPLGRRPIVSPAFGKLRTARRLDDFSRSCAARANRVANGLRALGLEPGDRVAICLPMTPEILPIFYGCFKAGLDRDADLRGLRHGRHRDTPERFGRTGAVYRGSSGAPRQASSADREDAERSSIRSS